MRENTFVLFSNTQVGMWSSSHLFLSYVAWINKLDFLRLDILERWGRHPPKCESLKRVFEWKEYATIQNLAQSKQSRVYTNMVMQIIGCPTHLKWVSGYGIERHSNSPSLNFNYVNDCAEHWCLFSKWILSTLPCGWWLEVSSSMCFKPTWLAHESAP